ncbi:MAG: hypothetical protein CVV27_01855 [Candidatus Melainabacteria bacterium HGW-Melainabacteria-1]|nr:MAG: hypothetical protein CVV27_01855 [Candidatus Melainabacteria bacterium HGW-Melainabacteria-1]
MYGTNLTDLEGESGELRISVSDTDIVLYFPFLEAANQCIKGIEGAEFSSSDKSWSLPITDDNWRQVRDAVEAVREAFASEQRKAEHRAQVRLEIADMVLARLQRDFSHPKLNLDVVEGDISLSFPYSPKAVQIMRKVEGRRWDGEEKVWLLPADEEKKIRSALKALRKVIA